jgi:SAM-dependent methyltransferase
MRQVFRLEENPVYWDRRWAATGRDPDRFTDLTRYPIRYAELVVRQPTERILELGCGMGRLLKHYAHAGLRITGVERSDVAVRRIHAEEPALPVCRADVQQLPFGDACFDVVLAFGLYHNLEQGMEAALAETARCLRPGGAFCISMRPDNLAMRANEWLWRAGAGRSAAGRRRFHKWLVGEREFGALLQTHGLRVARVHHARNVSPLYRLAWLRAVRPGEDETARRGRGYALNGMGRLLDGFLTGLAPAQFCNLLVFIGSRVA